MEAMNWCNDGASIKMKLELFLKQLSEKSLTIFNTLEKELQLMTMMKTNIRVKLVNFWMFPSYDFADHSDTIVFSTKHFNILEWKINYPKEKLQLKIIDLNS